MSESKCEDLPGWCHIDMNDIEIGDRIGGGGAGIIYKGWLRDEPVALKTLFDPRVDDSLRKEYMDELLVMSKLKHSNIVSFMGASMTPPNLCFVMELCRDSLYNIIHEQRVVFTDRECIDVALDVSTAMEYLHCLKPAIIHRDLKSLNVLQAHNGVYKLCDFGLVRNTNIQAGTPAYMAPELFANAQYNKSVDVYSFGIMLWEVLTGEIPFYMVDVPDIRLRVMNGQRPRIQGSGASPKFARLIQECWYVFICICLRVYVQLTFSTRDQEKQNRPDFTEIVDILTDMLKDTPECKHTEVTLSTYTYNNATSLTYSCLCEGNSGRRYT